MLIILLLWLRTQMLDGPLGQTALHKVGTAAGLHCKLRVFARQRIKHVSDILAFESIETGGKIFICSRDEAVYIRLCLKDVLFGQLDLQNWQPETRQIPAALVVDCRGLHDALARSSSSSLGLKDKKSGLESGLEALALKQEML